MNTEHDAAAIAAETMHGDLTQALLSEIHNLPEPWQSMPEDRQQDVIDRLHSRVSAAVTQAIAHIAAGRNKRIAATLEQITAKDGIKAVLTLGARDPSRHDLLDSVGQAVLIVVPPAELIEPSQPPRAEPNQRALAIGSPDEE